MKLLLKKFPCKGSDLPLIYQPVTVKIRIQLKYVIKMKQKDVKHDRTQQHLLTEGKN